jgi:hypothetical protein
MKLAPEGLVSSTQSRLKISDNSSYTVLSASEAGWANRVSGSYYEYDVDVTDLGISYGGIIEIYIYSNHNAAGSGIYYNGHKQRVVLDTTWHGSGYTPLLKSDVNVQATGSATVDCVLANTSGVGTNGEYQSYMNTSQSGGGSRYWTNSGIFLRVKWTGFNSATPGQQQMMAVAYMQS